jgi:hypothetical protein
MYYFKFKVVKYILEVVEYISENLHVVVLLQLHLVHFVIVELHYYIKLLAEHIFNSSSLIFNFNPHYYYVVKNCFAIKHNDETSINIVIIINGIYATKLFHFIILFSFHFKFFNFVLNFNVFIAK